MNSRKSTIKSKIQRRESNLSEVDIDLMLSANSRKCSAINNWQVQLCSKHTVNTTFCCATIDKCAYSSDAGHWWIWLAKLKIWIKTYVDKNCRSVGHQQVFGARAAWNIKKAALCVSHKQA